jgi:hypothetical protein
MNIQYIINPQNYAAPINIQVKQESEPTIHHCMYCNEIFQAKKDLKAHKVEKHSQIVKNEQKSRKINAASDSQSIGNQYVPQQARFRCEFCFKSFNQQHRLKQHEISHREPIFACDQVNFQTLFDFIFNVLFFSAIKNSSANIG